MLFSFLLLGVGSNHTITACVAEMEDSCPGNFDYFLSSHSFNLSEIEADYFEDYLGITFVDPPDAPIQIKHVPCHTDFYATGSASAHGIRVNFSLPSPLVGYIPEIRFENFILVMIMGKDNKMSLSRITFRNCTFRSPVSRFVLECTRISFDFASASSCCSSGLAEIMTCSFSIDTMLSSLATTLVVRIRDIVYQESIVDLGDVRDDCLMVFGHNWVDVVVGQFVLQFVLSNVLRMLGSCRLYGANKFVSSMPLDVPEFEVPAWLVSVLDGNVTFSGDWPKMPLEQYDDFLILDVKCNCEITIESPSVPVSIINTLKTELALVLDVPRESASITREIRGFSKLTLKSNGSEFECTLNQTELPLKEFNVLTKEMHVRLSGRFGNGTHVLKGPGYYELDDVKIGPWSVLDVSNLYIRPRNLVTIEFTYTDPSVVTPVCGFLNLDQVKYQNQKALLSFMFMPLFEDVPNFNQMRELVNGFEFVRTNVSVLKMDFDMPESGMRWFNKETNILHLERSRGEATVRAKSLVIPNDYPEFFCIADNAEKCIGQTFITKEEVPSLPSRLRQYSTEMRLSVYCDLPQEYALHLALFSPRLIKISSDVSSDRPKIYIVDESISGVDFSNVNVEFLQTNVSVVNAQFTGCEIIGLTDFSASKNLAVDLSTLRVSKGLHFSDVILNLGSENVTLSLEDTSIVVDLGGDKPVHELWMVTNEVISGRLTVTTSSPRVEIGLYSPPYPKGLFPMDLELTQDCTLVCDEDFNEAKIQGRPMSVNHYDRTLRISGAMYFPGVLHGTGDVHIDGDIVLTETQVPTGTCIFYVPTVASIFYMRSCEVHADCEFYLRSEDNKPVEVKISHLLVNASMVTVSLHVFDSMTIAPSGKLESASLKSTCPLIVKSSGSNKLSELFCNDLIIVGHGGVEARTVFVGGSLVMDDGLLNIYDAISVSGDVFLSSSAVLITGSLSVHGSFVIGYSMGTSSLVSAPTVAQMPTNIALKYTYPGYDENFSQYLEIPILVVASTSWVCSNSAISFRSDDNWYFQGPDAVVSSICNGSMYIRLVRLPQPRPTRHISLVSRDIILIVFLGGCAISAIITITVIFVVRFIRDPHMLEERFVPINTALV